MPHPAPGDIHIATTKTNNAYLIDDDDGLTLVDVGSGKAVDLLLRTMTELGRDPADPNRIVLTHAHPDHVKGATALREHTSALASAAGCGRPCSQ
ncbi:MBL fold metallo-hydrolase [Streptomyces sp. NPDC007206]|uniref:MBL fold metallo-hydrolase n=1 Tax=Streptomyces sp. NPDC007206 TaxID=3154317 RepID=UPI0033F2D0E5